MPDFAYVAPEPESVLAILQDHGPGDGGWGPATIVTKGAIWPRPMITTRNNAKSRAWFAEVARQLANETGKPTKVISFKREEELLSIGGSS